MSRSRAAAAATSASAPARPRSAPPRRVRRRPSPRRCAAPVPAGPGPAAAGAPAPPSVGSPEPDPDRPVPAPSCPLGTTSSLINTPRNHRDPFTSKKQPRPSPIGHTSSTEFRIQVSRCTHAISRTAKHPSPPSHLMHFRTLWLGRCPKRVRRGCLSGRDGCAQADRGRWVYVPDPPGRGARCDRPGPPGTGRLLRREGRVTRSLVRRRARRPRPRAARIGAYTPPGTKPRPRPPKPEWPKIG
jgi:hypothetical protein